MTWDDRLDHWDAELELASEFADSDWVTLEQASIRVDVSRAALRTWYRKGVIPSRLIDGPHGPQRLVPLAAVAARAAISPRLRHASERRLAADAELDLLAHRIDRLEARLAVLEAGTP
jgi:transposase